MEFIDPDLLLATTGFTQQEMLALYGGGESYSTSQSEDSNEKSDEAEGDEQT